MIGLSLQSIVCFIGLFCKRDQKFREAYKSMPPHTCVSTILHRVVHLSHPTYHSHHPECEHNSECERSTSLHPVALGLQRLIGCLKLRVIFRKRATNHRARLRKMTYKDNPMFLHHPALGISYELPDSYILG